VRNAWEAELAKLEEAEQQNLGKNPGSIISRITERSEFAEGTRTTKQIMAEKLKRKLADQI
jgi:hypothetical protein